MRPCVSERSGLATAVGADSNPQAICPACGLATSGKAIEVFHGSSLYGCASCDLHFWHPVAKPDAGWYEIAYQGRDHKPMPLEPGHQFFLADPQAPKCGRLLDIGCGVGNFLAAARDIGFETTGIEFDRAAVSFAQQHYGLQRIFASRPEDFRAMQPGETFDVVTFFEVLEHQDEPTKFLNTAKELLSPNGFVALSVPNRDRWQKGVEPLDYPPNHLTRWSPTAVRNFLERNGFEILSLRQERLDIWRTAQVLSAGLRTGLVSHIAGERPPTLSDLAEMSQADMQDAMKRVTERRGYRVAAWLARGKNLAMIPSAALLLPYLRWRGETSLYLYCLARRKQYVSSRQDGARR